MDADELLTQSLQAEEDAAAKQSGIDTMMELLQHGLVKAQSAEDPAAQAAALALLPLEQLRREAQATSELNRLLLAEDGVSGAAAAAAAGSSHSVAPVAAEDLLVQAMLKWFKHSFFSWVDKPTCEVCGGSTSDSGMVPPSADDQAHQATRVEAYTCTSCSSVTRFPRYTSLLKLLQTRRGRCGEWAHTFLLLLRAAGLDARHVIDDADHVWCEYYSIALGRWVHVDACEDAWDQPLLYEGGWGKKLGYVFAASRHGVADVTRRYVLAAPAALAARRHLVPEPWLAAALTRLTGPLRAALDQAERQALGLRDAAEALQLMALEDNGPGSSSNGSSSAPAGGGRAAAAAAAAQLPGRQSGSEAWRAARGETGTSSHAGAAAGAAAAGTPYQAAPDTDLPPNFALSGRLTGGAARASGENPGMNPSQVAGRLFDSRLDTKWLDFGGGGTGGSAWAEYRLPAGAAAAAAAAGGNSSDAPLVVSHYDLVSAEDCPERDPCDWVLEAVPAAAAAGMQPAGDSQHSVADAQAVAAVSASSSSTWVVVDQRSQQRFNQRHQLRSYVVPAAARFPSRQWRLRITRTADPTAANSVQLACWNLYTTRGPQQLQRAWQQQQHQQQGGAVEAVLPQQAAAAAQPNGGSGGVLPVVARASQQLLYMSDAMCRQLASLVRGADNTGPDDVASAVSTLTRVLTNMQQHPGVPKFFQLSFTAAKLQPVVSHPLLLAALLEAGFRPLLVPAAVAAAGSPPQLRLVADGLDTGGSAAVAALLALPSGSPDSEA